MSARALVAAVGLAVAGGLTAVPAVAGPEPTVDWGNGRVTATGVGLADRQAPNPAVARGPARRRAEDAARAQLARALPALPLATGGTVADKLADKAAGPARKARLDAAVASAQAVDAELETDGSWRITMTVPIEAVRQALTGPRPLPAGGDGKVLAAIVVEGVTATPAVGYTVGGLAAPTIWVRAVPAWAKDAPRIQAKGARAGAIDAAVPKAASDATLFVIVTPKT